MERTDPVREAEWAAHAEGVRRLARELVYDPDRAEDVAQEAMRIAIERPPAAGRPLREWLRGIVRNVARNVVRGDRHRRERERRAARPDAGPPADAWIERLAEQRRAIDAVLALEEPYRVVVTLRYFEDLSVADVAARLAVPLETVRTRLRRARERLRATLDDAHGGDRRRWALALLPLGAPPAPPPAPLLVGALAVKKTLLAIGILALVGAGAWWALSRDERIDRGTTAPEQARRGDPPPPVEPPALRGEAAPAGTASAAPPPVDLEAVDRDRDLHGVVVDAAGKPVGGARVRARTETWRWAQSATDLTTSRVEETVHGETTSSRDGTFAVRLERAASVNLRVEAAGFATWEKPFEAAGARVRVVLGPPVRLVVVAHDEKGKAVPGATVRFSQSGSFMVGLARPEYAFRREGTTDPAGRVVFDDLLGKTWGILDVEHPMLDSGSAWRRLSLPASGERVEEVVLVVGRPLRGVVTDAETRAPIAGAIVGKGWYRGRAVRTDAQGRYVYPGWVGEGESEFSAWAPGHVLGRTVVGEKEEIDFALAPGRVAHGRVLDRAGSPVAGAVVRARSDEDPNGATAGEPSTDAEGHFEFRELDQGRTYRFRASHDTRRSGSAEPVLPPEPGIAIEVGDLVLIPGWRVEGRVLDDDGHPVEGMEVTLASEQRVTDDLGRFRIAGVPFGGHTLEVRGAGRGSVSREVPVHDADVLGLEVRVGAGTRFEVWVDADDEPLPMGVTVELVAADGSLRAGFPDEQGRVVFVAAEGSKRVRVTGRPWGWLSPEEVAVPAGATSVKVSLRRAATIRGVVLTPEGAGIPNALLLVEQVGRRATHNSADARGKFRVDVEPEGPVDLKLVFNPAKSPVYGEVRGVAPGSADVVIATRKVPTDRKLVVRVVGPDGRPVEDAFVSQEGGSAKTDAAGRATFEGLPALPTLLVVLPAGERTKDLGWLPGRVSDVVPDGQEVVITLRVGGRLRGRVTDASGPVRGAGLEARHGDEGVAWGATNPDGEFALVVDPDAHFPLVLRVRFPGDRATEIDVPVERLPTTPLEVRAPSR